MKKVLFLLSAVLIAALSIVACQKDNTLTEVIPVSGDEFASDRTDCGAMTFQIVGSQMAASDYARITYVRPDGVTVSQNINAASGFFGFFTIKAGTGITLKHRLTCNTGTPKNYIKTRLSNGTTTKYYKYQSDGSGSVKSYVCQQTNCSLPDAGSCGDCADIPDTDPTSTPDYWCN